MYENNWIKLDLTPNGSGINITTQYKSSHPFLDNIRQVEASCRKTLPNVGFPKFDQVNSRGQNIASSTITGKPISNYISDPNFSFKERIELCRNLCSTIDNIIDADIIPLDINPYSICHDEHSGNLTFLDVTSLASRQILARNTHFSNHIQPFVHYAAPEQLAYNRPTVDYRSTIYSMAAFIFHIISKQQIFTGKDALSVRHKHINTKPPNLIEKEPQAGQNLSNVLELALQKQAKNRYESFSQFNNHIQKACSLLLEGDNQVKFDVNTARQSHLIKKSEGLLINQEKLKTLHDRLASASKGEKTLILYESSSQAHRLLVMESFLDSVDIESHFIIQTDFEKTELTANEVIHNIASSVIKQLDALPEIDKENFKQDLNNTLDSSGALLISIHPGFSNYVVADQALQEISGSGAQFRLQYVLGELFCCINKIFKTLIFYFKDFQLADYMSIKLVQNLLESSKIKDALFVAHLSEQQHENAHFEEFRKTAFPIHKEIIVQENCTENEVQEMLEELNVTPIKSSTDLFFKATNGNPELIQLLLEELSKKQLLIRNTTENSWQLDISAALEFNLLTNMDGLFQLKVSELNSSELSMVQSAAILGERFKLDQLELLIEKNGVELNTIVQRLRENHIIQPSQYFHARLVEMEFTIPGLRDYIISLLPKDQKSQLEKKLIKLHLNRESSNINFLYEIASHILNLPTDLAAEFYPTLESAAIKANSEGAFQNACLYCKKMADILAHQKHSSFDKLYSTVEYAIFVQNFKLAEEQLIQLKAVAQNKLEHSRIYILHAIRHVSQENYELALDNLVEGLNYMGIPFKREISKFQVISLFGRTLFNSRKINSKNVKNLKWDKDEHRRIAQKLINASSGAIFFIAPQLMVRINHFGIKQALKSGRLNETPYDLISSGFLTNSFSNALPHAHRLCKAGLTLLEEPLEDEAIRPVSHFMYGAFVEHTQAPLQNSIDRLQLNYRKARETGNIYTAFYCLGLARWYAFLNGTFLGEMKEQLNASKDLCIENKQDKIAVYHEMIGAFINEIRSPSFSNDSLSNSKFGYTRKYLDVGEFRADRIIRINTYMLILFMDYARGSTNEEQNIYQYISDELTNGGHGSFNSIFILFIGLVHHFKSAKGTFSKKFVRKNMKVLEARSKTSKENHRVKFELLIALESNKKGQYDRADVHFKNAYELSLDYDNPIEKAMASIEYGSFLKQRGFEHISSDLFKVAVKHAGTWGAHAWQARIKEANPSYFKHNSSGTRKSSEAFGEGLFSSNRLTLATRLLSATDLTKPIEIDKLMRNALSQFQANRMVWAQITQDGITILSDTSPGSIPNSFIQSCIRKKKSVQFEKNENTSSSLQEHYFEKENIARAITTCFIHNSQVRYVLYVDFSNYSSFTVEEELADLEIFNEQLGLSRIYQQLSKDLDLELDTRTKQVHLAQQKTDELIRNILPDQIAEELKEHGKIKARQYENVSVMFTDFVGFTKFTENLDAETVIGEIDLCFQKFDLIIEQFGLEKIKTIGDAYMCAGGIPKISVGHEQRMIQAAIEMVKFIEDSNAVRVARGVPTMGIRVGINTGPIIAGVVGIKKYAYDIWGSTVNIAARMESNGEPGRINISGAMYLKVKNQFRCTFRGKVEAKNVGEIDMYFVDKQLE